MQCDGSTWSWNGIYTVYYNVIKMQKKFACKLCKNILSRSSWYSLTGKTQAVFTFTLRFTLLFRKFIFICIHMKTFHFQGCVKKTETNVYFKLVLCHAGAHRNCIFQKQTEFELFSASSAWSAWRCDGIDVSDRTPNCIEISASLSLLSRTLRHHRPPGGARPALKVSWSEL